MPQQFKNPANPQIHRETTAEEIWADTDGKVDIFVAESEQAEQLQAAAKFSNSEIEYKNIAVEPKDSAVLSGGKAGTA